MHSRKKGLMIALGTCFGGIVLFLAFCILIAIFTSNPRTSYSRPLSSSSDDHIDILSIQGEITSTTSSWNASSYHHQAVLDTLDTLINDPSNQGLILFLDTPGGSIYETDEVYLKLLAYKKTGRPIYAALGRMATSGGYYLASAADYIVCNRNTITGSIGVVMPSYIDLSEFLSKNGIKVHTPTAGSNKAMGSPYSPISEEQLAIVESILGEAHEQFMEVVATGRHMDQESVATLADGRIYSAKQALAHGLVDQIGTLDDAIALMQNDYNLNHAGINTLPCSQPYRSNSLLFKVFNLIDLVSARRPSNELESALSLQESMTRFGYYYSGALSP
ncbi:MAG: signal peptide peptidase SppA [Cellulosilyticaceae bacterium]